MGQYFRFFNLVRKVESTVGVDANAGLPWAKSMNKFSAEYNKKIFEQVIADNGWDEMDDIEAIGDYDDVISWSEVKEECEERD